MAIFWTLSSHRSLSLQKKKDHSYDKIEKIAEEEQMGNFPVKVSKPGVVVSFLPVVKISSSCKTPG